MLLPVGLMGSSVLLPLLSNAVFPGGLKLLLLSVLLPGGIVGILLFALQCTDLHANKAL